MIPMGMIISNRIVNSAGDNYLISEVNAHPMMDANELLSVIARGFGLLDIPASPGELQNNLYQYLAGLQHNDAIPVLIVDDAHELPQDALEALFYLSDAEASEGNLLRTVLFCEPSINRMLDSAAIQPLKSRVTHNMEIPPLDEEQTAEYLKHRLAVAGLEDASPFTPKEIKRIYKASNGVPDKINEAAHLILNGEQPEDMSAYDEEDTEPPVSFMSRLPLRYIALGGSLLLVLGLVLVWQDEINQLFSEPPSSVEQPKKPTVEEAEEITTGPAAMERTIEMPVGETDEPEVESGDAEAAAGHRVEPAPEADPVTDTAEAEPDTPSAIPDEQPVEQPAPVETETTPVMRITRVEPDPVPTSDQQQTLVLHGEGFTDQTRITVEWGNQRKTLPTSRLTRVDASRLEFRITVGTTPDTWLVIARDPETGTQTSGQFEVKAIRPAAKRAPVTGSLPEGSRDIAWLKQQPADYFTLQLLASRQIENLRTFIKQHRLDGQTVIFESRDSGKPWYAVAYGSYPSRQAAEQAGGELPAGINPWIRQFASIQQGLSEVAAPAAGEMTPTVQDKPIPQSTDRRDHAAWLWDQDPSRYTLQLLGGQNEQAVKQFINQQGLQGEAVFYRTRRDGKPWYVVVKGSYPDRQAALSARQQLSPQLQQQSPWPRSFSDIHADLYRN